MRRIYLVASEADAKAAGELEAQLKQRGYTVRRNNAEPLITPAMPGEITFALWSGTVQMSPQLMTFTHRVMDAWSDGTLIFARLDHAILPRGLSDLETLDLTFEPARVHKTREIVEQAEQISRAAVPTAPQAPSPAPGGATRPAKRQKASGFPYWLLALLALLGLAAAALIVMTMMRGPVPDPGPEPVLMGFRIQPLLIGLGVALLGAFVVSYLATRRASHTNRKTTATGGEAGRDSVTTPQKPATPKLFFSYASADRATVLPLASAIEASGRPVWIDKQGIASGTEWAGEIVRAIRSSERVLVMCSASAFSSDHVRREVYLADKFKRPLLPVRLDGAEPPDDLVYFLVDKQWLDLTAIAAEAREAHLRQALS